MKRLLVIAGLLGIGTLAGCEGSAPSAPSGGAPSGSAPAPPQPAAAGPEGGKTNQPVAPGAAPAKGPAGGQSAAGTPAPPATPPATPPAATPPGNLRQAEVGAGTKGHYGGPGFITTPIATKFRIEEHIALNIQIPQNMKLYKAEHNDKGPKSHEEFMEVIIKEPGVKLPELAEGETYLYVPELEELMIKSPDPTSN